MQKRKSKKSRVILGSLIIVIGVLCFLAKYSFYYCLDIKNVHEVEIYLKQPDHKETKVISNTKKSDYIAVLEIPSISLKRGLVDKDSKNNIVSKNIKILDNSEMPDVENSTLYLASHSGTSYLSFFKDIYKLKDNDIIYIYYNNFKYTYHVSIIYEEIKDGDIDVYKNNNQTSLILTTCSQNPKGNQIIVVGVLDYKEVY